MTTFQTPNPGLKAALSQSPGVGCHWLMLGAPALAELAADAGAQCIVFDLQHGAWDRSALHAAVGAVGGRAPTLARTADASYFALGSALDAGCHGVIVPMISSAEACAEVVAACHFPPKGRRSGGGPRPMADFGAYRRASAEHLLVSVMIETVEGLEAAEAIAATSGLDMIFIGPNDLSLAMGERQGSPAFEAALTRILAAGKAAGVPVGIYTGDPAQAAARVKQGFRFVVVTSDGALNLGGAASAWGQFKAALG